MESVITLQELAKREAKKESADRAARVKALRDEGLQLEAAKAKPLPKKRGGRVTRTKSYFSPY